MPHQLNFRLTRYIDRRPISCVVIVETKMAKGAKVKIRSPIPVGVNRLIPVHGMATLHSTVVKTTFTSHCTHQAPLFKENCDLSHSNFTRWWGLIVINYQP